jgi:hypothetical protein
MIRTHLQLKLQMILNFLKEERAKRIVIRVINRPKLLPLCNAESKVLELAFPFTETSLQQDATFPVQLTTIEGEIAQAGKEGHCTGEATGTGRLCVPQPPS